MSIQAHLSEAYDAASSPNYKLRMLVHTAVAEYLLLSKRGDVLAFKSFPNVERSLLPLFLGHTASTDPILRAGPFEHTTCLTLNPHWMLLPDSLFRPETGEYFLQQFCNYETSFHRTEHRHLAEVGLHITYALDVDLDEACQKKLKCTQLEPLLAQLIQIGLKVQQKSQLPVLCFIHQVYDCFFYFILKGGKLVFANLYPMFASEDVIYFVLRVNMALNIASEETSLLLTGNAAISREVETSLGQYFGPLVFLEDHYSFALPAELPLASCIHLLPPNSL